MSPFPVLWQCPPKAVLVDHAAGFAVGHDDQRPRPSWGVTDSIAEVLGACHRPALFIPPVETHV